MTGVAGSVLSPRAGLEVITTPEWASLCTRRPNVVLEGSPHWTESIVLFLAPHLRRPISWTRSEAFAPPGGECASLVIEQVGSLRHEAQLELLQWLERADKRRQVVSTTEQPLFTLVGRGLFDESLYYRLNVILLRADAAGQRSIASSLSSQSTELRVQEVSGG